MKPICIEKARRIAGEWHNGKRLALYAFASTGTITPGFLGECREAQANAADQRRFNVIESIGYWEAIELVRFAEHHAKVVEQI